MFGVQSSPLNNTWIYRCVFNLGAGVSGFEGSECMVQALRLGI